MKTILSAVQTWTKGKIKESAADWNENDSSKDSYVKNRTHWEEEVETTIIPATDVVFEYVEDGTVSWSYICNGDTIAVGRKYTVIWDGVEYDCIGVDTDGVPYIGNSDIWWHDNGYENNGMPFCVYTEGVELWCGIYNPYAEEAHTISIITTETVVHTLDPKYLDLPTNLATTDDVQGAIDMAEEAYQIADNVSGSKMDAINPVGTGSFSMNREAGTTVGAYSSTLGNNNRATGNYSHAEGQYTSASGVNSHAEGGGSHVSFLQASGDYSHAEGYNTHATGTNSHAEGKSSEANGENSHAEGYNTHATGTNSHAEGGGSVYASGESSHAEGQSTTASGDYSHAEGYHTTASGTYSHAGGQDSVASRLCQFVFGQYNIEDDSYGIEIGSRTPITSVTTSYLYSTDAIFDYKSGTLTLVAPSSAKPSAMPIGSYFNVAGNTYWYKYSSGYARKYTLAQKGTVRGVYAHIVGNGTSDTARSNAHTLDWDGLGWFAGGLKVGGTGQDDEAAVEVALKTDIPETIIQSVNGVTPDENGNVVIEVSGGETVTDEHINELIDAKLGVVSALVDEINGEVI